ncbi:sensor domain-containing diguanylate cyclase [Psychrosphaera sp.]|nr:sensor domain-containing diguanylate cyclase [Psychrosphaera sp.]
MSIKIGIAIRLAALIITSALGIALLASNYFYKQTYNASISNTKSAIAELFTTVSSTVSIAAFVVDEELVKETVNGISRSKNVKSVMFIGKEIEYKFNEADYDSQLAITFDVMHPFISTQKLGEIIITPDYEHIKRHARLISDENSLALYLLAIFVTAASIVIGYFLVTRPLVNISKVIYGMETGTGERVNMPKSHKNTELGSLVTGVNRLLDNVQKQINRERQLRAEIELLEQRFRMIFESAKSAIVLIDSSGRLVIYNKAFVELLETLGLYTDPKNSEFGPLLLELFDDPKTLMDSLREAFNRNEIATGEYRLKSFVGSKEVWVQLFVNPVSTEQNEKYFQVTLSDISKRKQDLAQLAKQADFDALTNVLNRNGGEKKATLLINNKQHFALVLVDLNGFKLVNDTYGHDAGDAVLTEVAKRLVQHVRHNDTVIRWGGDEFVILLRIDYLNQDSVKSAVDKIRNAVTEKIVVDENKQLTSVGMSAGVAFFSGNAETLDELVKRADAAMYQAKELKLTNPEKYLFFANKKSED